MSKQIESNLRQMIAALEDERQALATLDADQLINAAQQKESLCERLAPVEPGELDPRTLDLVKTAQTLNEVNRRVRNLLAANVSTRLEAMGAPQHTYASNNSVLSIS